MLSSLCSLTLADGVPVRVSQWIRFLPGNRDLSTGRYCGSPSGQKNSAEFEHQLFPDMQNSFLESQAGGVENTGSPGKFGKAHVRLF